MVIFFVASSSYNGVFMHNVIATSVVGIQNSCSNMCIRSHDPSFVTFRSSMSITFVKTYSLIIHVSIIYTRLRYSLFQNQNSQKPQPSEAISFASLYFWFQKAADWDITTKKVMKFFNCDIHKGNDLMKNYIVVTTIN